MSESYSNIEFWNDYWKDEKRIGYDFMFSEIIDQYLDWTKIKNYMEIGGAPGTIMSYMFHVHNLEVNTVDFCDLQILSDLLERNNVKKYNIFNEDFSEFDISDHHKKYDLVASWGFIEHFRLDKSKAFIEKQMEMVADDGYLVIELPNIRRFNWLLYRLMNNELLKVHNTKTMDLNFIKHTIEQNSDFEILYGNYYLTSFIEYSSSNGFFDKHRIIKYFFCALKRLFSILHVNNLPNRFFSPYIVFIARRTNGKIS